MTSICGVPSIMKLFLKTSSGSALSGCSLNSFWCAKKLRVFSLHLWLPSLPNGRFDWGVVTFDELTQVGPGHPWNRLEGSPCRVEVDSRSCTASKHLWIITFPDLATDPVGLNRNWRAWCSWTIAQNKTKASFCVWEYPLSAALSGLEVQINGHPSRSKTAPIPTPGASATGMVGLSGADTPSVDRSPTSLIKLRQTISSVHRHSSDDWAANNGCGLVAKLIMNHE